ncbi:MAG: carboxypeptidase-like regulatory domain-containing protein [Bacteroidota bacterium]|nr:carboxypeptidase-like regulatory domain-containing protein [Bacteroidota bacterium]
MQKLFLFLVCFAFCARQATAQTVSLNGYVKDSLTHLPVFGATLSNSTKGQKVSTDGNGFFRIQVSPNDLLYALALGYHYDTLRYSVLFQDTITLFLSPVNVLQAVTVETGYQKYQLDSLQRRREFEEARGHQLSAIDKSKYKQTFGLTLNLDRLFKKRYKDGRKAEDVFTAQEKDAYVRFRFPPQLVSFYTGLKGEPLLAFMRQYTPSYNWLRSHHHREQLIDYLSESLKAYRNSSKLLNKK